MIRKAVQLEPTNYAYLDRWAGRISGWDSLRRLRTICSAPFRGARNDPTVHDHLGDVYERPGG